MSANEDGGSCLLIILGVILLWALAFGVTVDDKHYGISCSCAKGVEVHK